MNLLCLDTATDSLACALSIDGEHLEHNESVPRQHAERVLAAVDSLLHEGGMLPTRLDAIAFGRGPGSFTGLRIAAGVAQGLAFALDLPVIPVSTLVAIAQGSHHDRGTRRALVVLDARLGEVYAARCRAEAGIMRAIGEERLCRPDEAGHGLSDAREDWVGCGSGFGRGVDGLPDLLEDRLARIEPERVPRGRDLAVLAAAAWRAGDTVPAAEAAPIYLRERVAVRPGSLARG